MDRTSLCSRPWMCSQVRTETMSGLGKEAVCPICSCCPLTMVDWTRVDAQPAATFGIGTQPFWGHTDLGVWEAGRLAAERARMAGKGRKRESRGPKTPETCQDPCPAAVTLPGGGQPPHRPAFHCWGLPVLLSKGSFFQRSSGLYPAKWRMWNTWNFHSHTPGKNTLTFKKEIMASFSSDLMD